MGKFKKSFRRLRDPRAANARYELWEVLFIALAAVLGGAKSCQEMALFGRSKKDLFCKLLELQHGIPSHDTFSRVFRVLDPAAFEKAFQRFMAAFASANRIDLSGVIAIDGKVLRRSFDTASAKSSLHMVSAWGCEQRLVLGQIATDAKSNEITAVPKLLEMLSLKGCIVSVDAPCETRPPLPLATSARAIPFKSTPPCW